MCEALSSRFLCRLENVKKKVYSFISKPLSNTKGALGPSNIATAPAPPVGLAPPRAYVATSAATTIANRPTNNVHKSIMT
jgi:hypothetical protein